MDICEMRSSRNGKFFLTGDSDGNVTIFNSETGEKFGSYKTNFESGGNRMCVTDDGKYFVAAAYSMDLTLYETAAGKELYKDDTFFHVQTVLFSLDEKQIFVLYSDIMYTRTIGVKGLETERNISDYYPDSDLPLKLSGDRMKIKFPGKILKLEKSAMDMLSHDGKIYVAVFGGGMKCFLPNKKELWSVESNVNEHYQRIAYCEKYDYILGLGFKYNEPRTEPFHFVDVRSAQTGEIIYTVGLFRGYYYVFIRNGEGIASSNGDLYELGEKEFTLKENWFDI